MEVRSLRVGLIAEAFSADSGVGPWRYNYEILSSLERKRIDVKHVTSNPAKRRYLLAINTFTLLPYRSLAFMKQVDLLHATDPSSAVVLPLLAKKTLVTIHDLISLLYSKQFSFADRIFSRLVLSIAIRSSAIVASSEQTKSELVKYLRVPRQKIRVVNLGVSHRFRILPDVKKEGLLVGYVGKLTLRKRVDFLIEGFGLLKRRYSPYARLVIVGTGEETPRLRRLVRDLDLEDSVFFAGLVPEDRLIELYNKMSILVMPSDYEGFGFPIVEAQKCGTPVIIRKGVRISQEVASACIVVADTDELAETINDILKDRHRYGEVVRSGLENASRFTWEGYADRLISIYSELLQPAESVPEKKARIPKLEQTVKNYFQKPGTVSTWWDPEAKDTLFSDVLNQQIDLVITGVDLHEKRVLDVGAGNGRLSLALARSDSAMVSAIDLSREMLSEIAQRIPPSDFPSAIQIAQMDAETLAFADGSFHMIACLEALVHFPDPIKALEEFSRILTDGGVLTITVTLPIKFRTWLHHVRRINSWLKLKEWVITPLYNSRFYRNYVRHILKRPQPVSRDIPESALKNGLRKAGFMIVRRLPLDSPEHPRHLFLLAKKISTSRKRNEAPEILGNV